MTRTTTDLRRAIVVLDDALAALLDLLDLPEGDEPVYVVTASALAAALGEHLNGSWYGHDDEAAQAILDRLGASE